MSIFPYRRGDDRDVQARLEELEQAHKSLAREHESLKAEWAESVARLTLLSVPDWLRDYIERAKSTGWLVSCSPRAIVFDRPECSDHTYTLALPLPDDESALRVKRHALHSRIVLFQRFAA